MLIHNIERYTLLFRIIAIAIICLFTCNNTAFALAPKISLQQPEFEEEYLARSFLLTATSADLYIKSNINELLAREESGIKIIGVRGLLKNIGQLAKIGIENEIGKPIIYIDTNYFYNETVIGFEKEKIRALEELREGKRLTYKQMTEWLVEYIDKPDPEIGGKTSREKADEINGQAYKKYPGISRLYGRIKTKYKKAISRGQASRAESLLNFTTMYEFYKNSGGLTDKDDHNINLAAHEPVDANEALIGHGFTRDEVNSVEIASWKDNGVFGDTVDELEILLRHNIDSATVSAAIRIALSKMLENLRTYKLGKSGKMLGIIQPRYDDEKHFYLGFATSKKIGLAKEFFDDKNSLYSFRVEALFHELFHATFSGSDEKADIEEDIETHLYSLKIQAQFFWGLSSEQVELATSKWLSHHPANNLWQEIYIWKSKQRSVSVAEDTLSENWKEFLKHLRYEIRLARRHPDRFLKFLTDCENTSKKNARYPVEGRYPILKAVTQLEKDERSNLVEILKSRGDLRKLTIVDTLLLMLDKDIPQDWASQQTPNLVGRTIYQVASEIWNPAGGLARVMQFHGMAMPDLLKQKAPHC